MPANVPSTLVKYIKDIETSGSAEDKAKLGHMIWFSCEGENPADIENMGKITYYPYPGVADFYFPYKNQRGYLSPAVFVNFENPKSKKFL